ncbi:outer dynein arm-docking complex subunit 3-like [Ruditapes philippinarum]|uniref:outer dynein arm-docking complex subunit 3-like n=1 Tax=Ruditapes philippinarum TaxID=129788 RepID=UPI00295BF1F7|nr:outer dynein arm-docking complex subunit 3-like [Ruditapes philippinarum]
MPGVLAKTDPKSVANKAWTLAEMVEETRGKLHLKERDVNAFYESCEVKKMEGEKIIANLRKENKRKRRYVAECMSGHETVIKTALHHRKKELLSLRRFTSQAKIYRMMKFKHYDYQELEQEIRRLQNEIDKAVIKVGAAKNITCRYEAIMDTLKTAYLKVLHAVYIYCKIQNEKVYIFILCDNNCTLNIEEVLNYPAILDCLEEKLKECTTEAEELLEMKKKAIISSEDSRRDLHTMEREMYQAKRARDQKLNDMKKDVEKRKELADRTDKKQQQRVALISDTSDFKQARLQNEKIERQEKILTLEDAFERIMNATHVSDIEDILYRLQNQDFTYQQLRSMEKEKMLKRNFVTEELTNLREVFEEIKFTFERQIKQGRNAVESMANYVQEQEKKRDMVVEAYQRDNKLLMDLQSGTATILEKLKDVRLKPPYHNFLKGEPIDDLLQCRRKLDLLLSNLGMKGGMPSPSYKIESEKLNEYLEARLPPDNIRIRIESDDLSDTDDFHFDHDQENDGFTSREEIKRQGQDILNSKLKPKKKKSRKRNN